MAYFVKYMYGFTLLQTYKVLKHDKGIAASTLGFTLLQTYKVLKLYAFLKQDFDVLHSYKLTRFSNSVPEFL